MPPKKTTSADQIKKDADKYDKQKKQERDERRVEKKLMRDEELTDEEKSIALRMEKTKKKPSTTLTTQSLKASNTLEAGVPYLVTYTKGGAMIVLSKVDEFTRAISVTSDASPRKKLRKEDDEEEEDDSSEESEQDKDKPDPVIVFPQRATPLTTQQKDKKDKHEKRK